MQGGATGAEAGAEPSGRQTAHTLLTPFRQRTAVRHEKQNCTAARPHARSPTLLGTATHIMLLLCIHVGQLFRWAPGTRSALTGRRLAVSFPAGRDAVKARDALLGQCPLGQPRGVRRRGYSPTDTAHEMRIPLRPLRMSKPYRRLRKRSLRSDSVEALLELSVPTVSPRSRCGVLFNKYGSEKKET